MSNGGWFGRGWEIRLKKLVTYPKATTDFVFSIVIEELGLIGAGLILALLFFLILRIMHVGIKAKNPFNSMIALGIGGMMLMQTFVNIGGISGLFRQLVLPSHSYPKGGIACWFYQLLSALC